MPKNKNYLYKYKRYEFAKEPRLPHKQIVNAVCVMCNIKSKEDKDKVKEIIDSYDYVMHQALVIGYKFQIPSIGSFCHYIQKGKAAGHFHNVYTGEWEDREATPDFKRPYFYFTEDIKDEIRDATRGMVKAKSWIPKEIKNDYDKENTESESDNNG